MTSAATRPTLLLVDDSTEVLEQASAYLEHQGYRVVCVADAFDALAVMREQKPHLVILDIQMPFEGDAVARLLDRFHSTPLIYYSAVDDSVGEALARKSKNASFVPKGTGLRALAREIAGRLIAEAEIIPPRGPS
ncbi:MAG: response regulator [Polyangiaceae bacterium]|nr:response regulator [Polyangiaceae bacterium]